MKRGWLALFPRNACNERTLSFTGSGVEVDRRGNLYLLVSYRGEIRLRGKRYFSRSGDLLLFKISPGGRLRWMKHLQATSGVLDYAFRVTPRGFLWLAGRFSGAATWDHHQLHGRRRIFVTRISPQGRFLWARTLRGKGNSQVWLHDLIPTPAGGAYVTGHFFHSLFFNNKRLAAPGLHKSLFLLKLNKAGKVRWVRNSTAGSTSSGYSLAAGPKGSVYLSGAFQGKLTLAGRRLRGPSRYAKVGFIARWSASGALDWLHPLPHLQGLQKNYLTVAPTTGKGLWLLGRFYRSGGSPSIQLEALTVPLPQRTGWVLAQWAPFGKPLWGRKVPFYPSLVRGKRRRLFVVSRRYGRGGKTPWALKTGRYQADIVLRILGKKGKLLAYRRYGGGSHDSASGLAVGPRGQVYLTGMLGGLYLKIRRRKIHLCPAKRSFFLLKQ